MRYRLSAAAVTPINLAKTARRMKTCACGPWGVGSPAALTGVLGPKMAQTLWLVRIGTNKLRIISAFLLRVLDGRGPARPKRVATAMKSLLLGLVINPSFAPAISSASRAAAKAAAFSTS